MRYFSFSLTPAAHAAPLMAAGGHDPMFILLNGAFGIGKTTTAHALLEQVPGSRLYDPEPVGVALQRASGFLLPGGRVDDFQDLASWRRLAAWGARRRHRGCAIVIVPMAFSNLAYLESLEGALARSDVVHRLCLIARCR